MMGECTIACRSMAGPKGAGIVSWLTRKFPTFVWCALWVFVLPLGAASGGQTVLEPVQVPAVSSRLAAAAPIIAVATAGTRIVGVGVRGHIVYSDNQGLEWTQAQVPVSVDLVSVQFPTPQVGWATGHDGVVLKSIDAGSTWQLVLEGRRAAQLMLDYYAAQPADDPRMQAALAESRRFVKEQGARPFLDVWFSDANEGFIVGAWGLVLHTTDAGATWTPWLHLVDNPGAGHLYAIRSIGSEFWIAGDQGLLLKLDSASGRFISTQPPEGGSLFGVIGTPDFVLAYGLLGRAIVSRDGGKTWDQSSGLGSSSVTGGAVLVDGRVVLVDGGAGLWISDDNGRNFSAWHIGAARPYTGVVDAGGKTLVLAGLGGVRALSSVTP
ncbi:WD40/YVTN/BNR-like repeat-containing protein [Pseudomonas sp. BF-RE-26]|uniref:WD40/YVTN/BNR-like repeat-containing protein n=1 Tax=Pseudomonas sp. BF-RE-26 TaxID=2832396 RepID=UPI001CC1502E|nr:YCF48-related protein [Pseudomonas sp. BF-RE-26]